MEVGYPRNVRARTTPTRSAPDAARRKKIAQAISARLRAKFPYKDYGAAHYLRGSPASLATFGQSGRLASEAQKMNRRNSGFTGRGAYWGRNVGQYLGGMGGAALAGMVGQPELAGAAGAIGSSLGGQAGDYMSDKIMQHLSGRGAYSTNALVNPSSAGRRNTSSSRDETGDVTISHSEYLQDIVPTSASFETQYFQAINPGLNSFLPWLSQMAAFYEEYEIIQLVYTFKSMVTDGNSTAGGTVIMATQYNPTSPAFILKQNMENYDYASSCKVTDNLIHGVECDPSKKAGSATEYIRVGPVPIGQDPKTYDLGVVQLATTGMTPHLNIGELWVHYKIRLSKAKIALPGSFAPTVMLTSGFQATFNVAIPTGATTKKLLGTTVTKPTLFSALGAALGGQVASSSFNDRANFLFDPTSNTIIFPPWINSTTFVIRFTFATTAASFGAITWSATGGTVNDTQSTPIDSTVANGYTLQAHFTCNSLSGTSSTVSMTTNSGIALYTQTGVYIQVIQVEPGYLTNLVY